MIPSDPSRPTEPATSDPPDETGSPGPIAREAVPDDRAVGGPASPPRPGSSTFTIEGRSAPALFVVGWLLTLVGLGAIAVALLAGGGGAAPILLFVGLLALGAGLVAGAGSQAIERRARGVPGYTGPSPFLVFGASIPVSLVLVILVGVPLTLLRIPVDGPLGRLLSVALQALVYAALIRLLVVGTQALSWRAMGVRPFDGQALRDLVGGAAWAVPVVVVTIPLAAILGQLFPVTPASPLPPTGDDLGFAMNLLAGAVIAPVGEELLFRGFATTAWGRSLGERRGLVRAALFFAVVHILAIQAGSAGEAVGLVVVGFASRIPVALALGWLFLRRDSIWAPIGLHAAFNGVLLTVAEMAVRNGLIPPGA